MHLFQPVSSIPRVSAPQAELLATELGLRTWADVLQHYPFRHEDRSVFHTVRMLRELPPMAQVRGVLLSTELVTTGKMQRLVGTLMDQDAQKMQLVWFNQIRYWQKTLLAGRELIAYGKPNEFRGTISIVHPQLTFPNPDGQFPVMDQLVPVYSLTEKLRKKGVDEHFMATLVRHVLDHVELPEVLPAYLVTQQQLIDRKQAFSWVHFPPDARSHAKATDRLKFEELFFSQVKLLRVRGLRQAKLAGWPVKRLSKFTEFYEQYLPFELTGAQKRVLKEIRRDMGSSIQMNRLVQGDVGSGKTIVAFLSMLMALDSDCQACLMAPTEILAEQHFNGLQPLANKMGLPIAKLTGSTKTKERKVILEALANGVLPFIVGTHALLEPTVKFKRLGLSVVDEQHRFGVAQRARLWEKNLNEEGVAVAPHILVMTATPIPRTLAMTLYGDLDVSVIDELPPGRKPIKTSHVYSDQRLHVWQFMERQLTEGRQVYVVYPLIEENEKLDLVALEQGFALMFDHFSPKGYHLSMVHGKQPKEERDAEMQRFLNHESHIMVATTVIEVGVNVPNASVMVIENANRFGLSQLHQLRGRVGRGADQSFCLLMTDHKLSQDAKERLSTMVRTTNGFEIAETDLKLRGPGDMLGTQQSGSLNFKIANIAADMGLLSTAREAAIALLEEDPELAAPENAALAEFLAQEAEEALSWSRIS